MTEEGWITFYEAAREIQLRVGGSVAEAQMLLRRACGDELIRTMQAPYESEQQPPFEFWTRVAPRAWRQREVDYDPPDRDGCNLVVMIHKDDFGQWLNKHIAATLSPPGRLWHKRAERRQPKRDLARQVIDDLWPGDIPDVTDAEITRQVHNRLPEYCKENNLPRGSISDDTILRAAGRKKK